MENVNNLRNKIMNMLVGIAILFTCMTVYSFGVKKLEEKATKDLAIVDMLVETDENIRSFIKETNTDLDEKLFSPFIESLKNIAGGDNE